jgi:hypothetical protein
MLLDQTSKSSYLDAMLVNAHVQGGDTTALYSALLSDTVVQTNTYFLPFSPLFQSEYQEVLSTTLLVAPELSLALEDYFTTY